jgi:hypothetical protein
LETLKGNPKGPLREIELVDQMESLKEILKEAWKVTTTVRPTTMAYPRVMLRALLKER